MEVGGGGGMWMEVDEVDGGGELQAHEAVRGKLQQHQDGYHQQLQEISLGELQILFDCSLFFSKRSPSRGLYCCRL